MKQNLSFIDREFRYFLGAGLILSALLATPSPLGVWAFMLLAAIPVITTAIIGWDPIYHVLGLSSRHRGDHNLRQKHWSFANVGTFDRIARFAIAGVIITTVMVGSGSLFAALLAVPVMLTAIMAWDPVYALADVNTLASTTDAASAEEVDEEEIPRHYTLTDRAANDQVIDTDKAA